MQDQNDQAHVITASGERRLPDPLYTSAGRHVDSVEQWRQERRPELLELFRKHIYGREPIGRPDAMTFHPLSVTKFMEGEAVCKRIEIRFEGSGGQGSIKLLIYIPSVRKQPVPAFVLIHKGNLDHPEKISSSTSPYWPVDMLVTAGYAAVLFDCAELDPDEHDGFSNGVHGIFGPKPEERSPDAWGTISAWAWGASRVMDYLQTDPDIDAARVAISGHSRRGKTALWAGALDERFAMIACNNSGCTGAAVSRGKNGETIRKINEKFPHWFNETYKFYNDREHELPVDQHMLVSLIAPRTVYVTSATEDAWADPVSEFLSLVHAAPVYRLYGLHGLNSDVVPQPEQPVWGEGMAYHLRTGKHDMAEYDWSQFIQYANKIWGYR
jgi:hypothetical protein